MASIWYDGHELDHDDTGAATLLATARFAAGRGTARVVCLTGSLGATNALLVGPGIAVRVDPDDEEVFLREYQAQLAALEADDLADLADRSA